MLCGENVSLVSHGLISLDSVHKMKVGLTTGIGLIGIMVTLSSNSIFASGQGSGVHLGNYPAGHSMQHAIII